MTPPNPYTHPPDLPAVTRGLRDRIDGVGCRENDGAYLDGWYSVIDPDWVKETGGIAGVLLLDGTVKRVVVHERSHRRCDGCAVHPHRGWHERDPADPDRGADAVYAHDPLREDAWGTS